LKHHWPASLQHFKQRLFRFAGTAGVEGALFDTQPAAGGLLQALLTGSFEVGAPAHERISALLVPVDESHPGTEAKQHLLAD
jgi:hypothetical protein